VTARYATAEGGVAGATVGVGDTGSGTPFDAGTIGTGGAFTYSSTGGCRRGGAGQCYAYSVGGTSALARRSWNVNAGNSAAAAPYRAYIDPADFSGATVIIARGMDSAANTQRWRLILTGSAVSLRKADNTAAGGTATSGVLSSGTRYRAEWSAAGSTTGAYRLIVYVGESTTAFYDSGAGTADFGGTVQSVHVGIAASATSQSGKIDDFMAGDPGDAAFGPAVPTGQLAVSGTGTLAGTGRAVVRGAGALSGAATLGVTGRGVARGAAALAGSGALAGAGRVRVNGGAALAGAGVFSAAGRVGVNGATTLAGSGALAAVGRVSVNGAGALAAGGVLAAAGSVTVRAAAAFLAGASAALAGVAQVRGAADWSAQSLATFTSSDPAVVGAADWAATGVLSVSGSRVVRGAASWSGTAAATLVPTVAHRARRRSSTPAERDSGDATARRESVPTPRPSSGSGTSRGSV
jgi:hypothetical protein